MCCDVYILPCFPLRFAVFFSLLFRKALQTVETEVPTVYDVSQMSSCFFFKQGQRFSLILQSLDLLLCQACGLHNLQYRYVHRKKILSNF